MELKFGPRNTIELEDARICWRNFKGEGSLYNAEGDRNFSVVIPNEEIAEALRNDINQYGAGWNVKIKAPRTPEEQPFMHLPVKVKYTENSQPKVFLESGKNKRRLTEETIGMLDHIDIESVSITIRPYDGEGRFGAHRTAYLQSIYVVQNIDRHEARFAEEEYPYED